MTASREGAALAGEALCAGRHALPDAPSLYPPAYSS
jgi:hypothetical protein